MNSQKGLLDVRGIIGIAVVFFGLLLLLRNIAPDFGATVWRWWPVLIMAVGLRVVLQLPENRQYITGSIIIIIGLFLLLNNHDIIELRFRHIWPVAVILIGLAIIFHNFAGRKGSLERDMVNLTLIFGGGEFVYNSRNFRGGKITALMGGGKIDLRDANPAADEIIIDALAIMGGLEIRVPLNWHVIMEGTPIMGGMENKTILAGGGQGSREADGKRLVIKGLTIMGGLEVKN
jgi:predicted membrane protein